MPKGVARIHSGIVGGGYAMDNALVTTGFELEGYKVNKHLGMVRGITVRSRSVIGNIGAALQSLVGGNISLYTELCEHARTEAYELMAAHAQSMGGNGIIGVRYDTNDIMDGVTEVVCYGTAVSVQPL